MRKLSDEKRRDVVPIRLSKEERAAVEAISENVATAIRRFPQLWNERSALVRKALSEVRGKFSDGEIRAVIDSLNGLYLTHELMDEDGGLLGGHVVMEVADTIGLDKKWGIDHKKLVQRLSKLTGVQRAALELWVADLWRDYQNDELWEREIAWLTGEAESSGESQTS